jgi:hypothetical protein
MVCERVPFQRSRLHSSFNKLSSLCRNWPGPRYATLLRLPVRVGNWEADGAGAVASRLRVLFSEKEDTVGNIATSIDGV